MIYVLKFVLEKKKIIHFKKNSSHIIGFFVV